MKIKKLLIYGFGKHENVTIELGQGMNVLYGSNEAGKTTIQQFILHVLFGFPQKNSTLLRYEPKSGGKYGGQILLEDELYGICTVERIRGKSAGDVIVHFEDGTSGGEELLQRLLRQYDRASYESIFSFSLLQLQGFEKMDESELSRTLLASGTTGVDTLMKVEKRMEKELSDLFKKSGRNPEMNVKLSELRVLEADLKLEIDKMDAYEPSIERLKAIEDRVNELRKMETEVKMENRLLSLKQQLLPLQKKKRTIEARLSELADVKFPTDGIRRFETLSGKLTETKAMEKKMENERTAMKSRMPNTEEFDRLDTIESLLAKESEWLSWHTIGTTAQDEQRQLLAHKGRLLDRLGIRTEERERVLLQADVSIQKEEEMHGLLRNLNDQDQHIGFSERQFNELGNELNNLEQELRLLKQSAPTDEDRKVVRKWPEIRERLAEAKAYVSLGGRPLEKNTTFISFTILLVAVACILFGFIQGEWLVLLAGGILGAVGVFYYTTKRSSATDPKMQEMESIIAAYKGKEKELTERLERISNYDREVERLELDYSALTAKYRQGEVQLDDLYEKRRNAEGQVESFLQQYGFDGLPSSGIIPELFRMIRDLQEIERNREQISYRASKAQEQIDLRVKEAEKALKKEVPQQSIYEMLRREFLRLKEEYETARNLVATIAKIEMDLKGNIELSTSLSTERASLMAEAGAITDTEFYGAFDQQQEVKHLTEQVNDLRAQLAIHGQLELSDTLFDNELLLKVDENEKKMSGISEELNVLLTEQAALLHKTEQLLTEETLGQKRQLFEMKKAEFAELAKKWSERKAVAEAIRLTMMELKEKKLPQVLEQANHLFHELTDGAYDSLEVTETGYFEAIAVTGMRHPIVELSQATKEQAYISLRFSLASSLIGSAPFPILMDDPFVHFDGERLSRMIQVLDKLQRTHQFMYFTCHETMKDRWVDATLLNVTKIGNRQEEATL